ncbi:response regulator transcription factor [Dehalococcoides mccartyi]|jgi:Response regulators consisting of a CheY-like receiver domain and a winged-helix DNA-binding domain|uniref:response regulator transcription factor n=1 Tax=Dehalococcoides mccartyi TaxID=61435 RepID=UPI00098F183E|nr:response regulator transcription factor [Dehalococcoides mccartyi]AQU02643.1 DNA-binding response regulator [Dehalococcoides mccartyi]AQU03978.1 DNA-binding response regulator [Dehalococcoides mccartyi]
MKILIIEDDAQTTEIVKLSFKLGWPDVRLLEASSGESGLAMVETAKPDAIILDIGLPDISGYEVLRQIRLFSELPVIILTIRNEESDIVKALSLGADDYLVKPFRQMELLARIKAISRRLHSPEVDLEFECGPFHFGQSVTKLYKNDKPIRLTNIEGQILYYLMRSNGRYIYNETIAQKIWGENAYERIRVNIRHLREKIEDNPSNPKFLINIPGKGYMFICQDSPKAEFSS